MIATVEKQERKQGGYKVVPRWKKGESGNPNGRPKKALCIPDILRSLGEQPVTPVMLARLRAKWGPDMVPKNNREAVLMVAYAMAHEGDPTARQFIAERTEGKVDEAMKALFNFGNINNGDNIQINLSALIQKRAHEYISTVRELGPQAGAPGLNGQGESVCAAQALRPTRTVSRT